MSPADYHVLSIGGQRAWEGRHGSFIDYSLTVDGPEGMTRAVQTRKHDSPAPEIGEVVYGHLETETIQKRDGDSFEKTKLRRDQRPEPDGVTAKQQTGTPSPGPQTSQTPTGVPPAGHPPQAAAGSGSPDQERQRRIERQHSQEMSLRFISAAIAMNAERAEKWMDEEGGLFSLAERFTDRFANDLESHSPPSTGHPSQSGNGEGGNRHSEPAPPSPEPSLDEQIAQSGLVEEFDEGGSF